MDLLIVLIGGALSFALQLLATQTLLPHLGGSASVWIGSLLFFQGSLFFAYYLTYYVFKDKTHWVKLFLILAGFINTVGLIQNEFIETPWPLVSQSLTLLINYGLIFMALLLISPQIQLRTSRRALDFYVASNLGALVGLLGYPLLVEPWVGLFYQKWGLIITYWFVVIYFVSHRFSKLDLKVSHLTTSPYRIWFWSALGTILLGSFSFNLNQDIISFPLLWVIPLTIYLVSFTWAFSSNPWGRDLVNKHTLSILEISLLIILSGILSVSWLNVILSLVLFTLIIIINQLNLAKLAPVNTQELPAFYYHVGLGGLIGGLVVNLLIPPLFPLGGEYVLAGLVVLAATLSLEKRPVTRYLAAGVLFVLFLAIQVYKLAFTVEVDRSYYGMVKVTKNTTTKSLIHGQIVHGQESLVRPGEANTYYQSLMVGDLFLPPPKKVLIVGLGAGVMLSYLSPKSEVDIIDIDELVVNMAEKHFTYIKSNKSKKNIYIGDGRKVLEKLDKQYDLIVVDAFSGDAIPTHLLTKEALSLYREKLTARGTLALHLSNNFLDLAKVVEPTMQAAGFTGKVEKVTQNQISASWGVFTRAEPDLEIIKNVWTDDFHPLWGIIKTPF